MLTRGTEGAMRSYRILMKGAGANGYICRFIHVCNYALRCYYSCYCHTVLNRSSCKICFANELRLHHVSAIHDITQKVTPSS